MSSSQHPDWVNQVQKFETNDQALAVSRREDVTHDPVVVGASLSAIADGLEADAARSAAQDGACEEVVIGGKVYVRAGGFRQLADGRNLPVFIAEGHPDALERGETAGAYDPDAAKRLRLVCTKLGLGAAVPETDAELMEAQFVVFGLLRAAIERKLLPGAAAQLEAGVLIKNWIREHEAELSLTEFARIDAALERLMMHLGVAIAGAQVPMAAGETVYRFLKRGERIQATDEYVDDDRVTWLPVGEGLFKGAEYGALMKPVRRAVDVTSGRVPDEFLALCEEELERGTLTSLPLKLRFGASRGLSLAEVHNWMSDTRQSFVTAVQAAAARKASTIAPAAPRYLVLRGVENSSTKHHPLPEEAVGRKIHQVWRLLDEAAFMRTGRPSHHGNAFLDDISHDWAMTRDGRHIRYFAHSSEKGDVVDIILEFEE